MFFRSQGNLDARSVQLLISSLRVPPGSCTTICLDQLFFLWFTFLEIPPFYLYFLCPFIFFRYPRGLLYFPYPALNLSFTSGGDSSLNHGTPNAPTAWNSSMVL